MGGCWTHLHQTTNWMYNYTESNSSLKKTVSQMNSWEQKARERDCIGNIEKPQELFRSWENNSELEELESTIVLISLECGLQVESPSRFSGHTAGHCGMSLTTCPETRSSTNRRVTEHEYKGLFYLDIDSADTKVWCFMHPLGCAYYRLPHLKRVCNNKVLRYLPAGLPVQKKV